MSEELDPKKSVSVDFDDKDNPEIMKISIPIRHFADHEIGTVLVKGFLDDIKEMALAHVRKRRMQKAQEEAGKGILLAKPDLKVVH